MMTMDRISAVRELTNFARQIGWHSVSIHSSPQQIVIVFRADKRPENIEDWFK